jgi:hypothetical protein
MIRTLARRPEVWVFGILLASLAFFWHGRDWNTASRLMLTYALGDRGTIRLDGLERQTGDIAKFQGHYYTDKLPGFSFLGLPSYLLGRGLMGWPPHPLNREGFPYWPADYLVTLFVSGLATATLGSLLTRVARRLGCGPRRSALVGLAYGLATPAYVYGTLAYGHQVSALALFWAFTLIQADSGRREGSRCFLAGTLTATAATVELQVAPLCGILAIYLLVQVVARRRSLDEMLAFLVGTVGPLLGLLGYNFAAFGSPLDMGYFHHATPRFAAVHSSSNPLGLGSPEWSRLPALLVGPYRGLLYYAPILGLAMPGWAVLLARRAWEMAVVPPLAGLAMILVNLSYPEWTGGWSTGPRLLVPMLPFAMVPVAGLLAEFPRWGTRLAVGLTLLGAILMLLFQGVGARLPDMVFERPLQDPLVTIVWPLWQGAPVPGWWTGERFTRTLLFWIAPETIPALPPSWAWIQFLPLVAFQAAMIAVMPRAIRPIPEGPAGPE